MALYLLRVGADTTEGGGRFRSPIFTNRSYLFIPVPRGESEQIVQEKAITYRDYRWNEQQIIQYVPQKYRDSEVPLHVDPEFVTFTYGSPKKRSHRIDKNYNTLCRMKSGDLLVFYAGFEAKDDTVTTGLYCFAYFIINKAVPYSDPEEITVEERKLIANNHHFLHNRHDQVIVCGDISNSHLLKTGVLISYYDPERRNYFPEREVSRLLGNYDSALNLSSIRTFQSENIANNFKRFIEEKGGLSSRN